MPHNSKFKILVLVGPTSSGKSELAVRLAKKFNGEIISCDSRQIYKGMDLGTGKVAGNWKPLPIASHPERVHPRDGFLNNRKIFIYKNVPHHCIDYINPRRQYSAAMFQRDATKSIADILQRGKLPILCGGTAHWIDAVVYHQQIPDVKPNLKLRIRLEKKSSANLYKQLQKVDPVRAKNIDRHNKRRLIRALEIVMTTGKPVPTLDTRRYTLYAPLWLGVNQPQNILYKKIDARLKQRLKQGMAKEVSRLHKQGLLWKRLESFGLEYKYVSLYLQKKLSYDEMLMQLSYAIKHYSKRQLTWWKRNKNIRWTQKPSDAEKMISTWHL